MYSQKIIKSISLIISLLLFYGCATSSAGRRPKWISGKDQKYPEKTYLLGIGIGKDIDSARAAARAEISKIFEARVEQMALNTETESSATREGITKTDSSQAIKQQTKVSTVGELKGVEIAETWNNKKKRNYYALALLNKPKTRARLSSEILDIEEKINSFVKQADESTTPIDKARGYSKALPLYEEKEKLEAKRSVVDPTSIPNLQTGPSETEIRSKLNAELSKIQFIVDANDNKRLTKLIGEKITGMGFKISDAADAKASDTQNPVIEIKADLTVEPLDRGNPNWKFYMWKGSFEMSESSPSGKVLASSAPAGQDGHLIESTAKAKAIDSGEKAMALETEKQISKYIFEN